MSDPSTDAVRAMTLLTSALIEVASRLASAATERWVQRMRAAALAGEHAARAERARLATEHAADAAIWRRTHNPAWWQTATPEQIFHAWQAVNTWHRHDDEAADVRHAMVNRLQERGVHTRNPQATDIDGGPHLRSAVGLAVSEWEERAARTAQLDTDAPQTVPDNHRSATVPPPARGERQPTDRDAAVPASSAGPIPPATGTQPAAATSAGAPGGKRAAAARVTQTSATERDHTDIATSAAPEPEATAGRSRGNDWPFDGSTHKKGRTETSARSTPADITRMESILRQTMPQPYAATILADQAWPVLANAMHQLDQSGADLDQLLKQVASVHKADGRIPAVHAASALRRATQSPAHLRSAESSRAQHQLRIQRAQQGTIAATNALADESPNPASHGATAENARLLNIAFPTTTPQALNRALATSQSSTQLPELMRLTQRPRTPAAQTEIGK